eukprot:TRINITY_DN12768_c0_g1_i2.p3 TRINITY_DN12768_c0_g1~~TRINITY_DN12768_c0_g1_i2.p3  ORF type:complete len:103 (+),score=22.54 TRINITY_DN12768_c0_g1_i2:122-430(+)
MCIRDRSTQSTWGFQYFQVSTNIQVDTIDKFSLLIISENYGAIIKVIDPPSLIKYTEQSTQLKSKEWMIKWNKQNKDNLLFYNDLQKKVKPNYDQMKQEQFN